MRKGKGLKGDGAMGGARGPSMTNLTKFSTNRRLQANKQKKSRRFRAGVESCWSLLPGATVVTEVCNIPPTDRCSRTEVF